MAIPSTDPPAYVMLVVLPVLVAPGIVPAMYRSELEHGLSAKGHCISHNASPPGVNHYNRKENQQIQPCKHKNDRVVLRALIACPLSVKLV
jgi:hypothetical protein